MSLDKQNNCNACKTGYRVENGQCVLGSASVQSKTVQQPQTLTTNFAGTQQLNNDPNCKKYYENSQVCEECYAYHYFNKDRNMCVQVHPTCKTWDPETGYCRSCYQGYTCGLTDRECTVIKMPTISSTQTQNKVMDNCLKV